MNADGTGARQLTTDRLRRATSNPSVSPDGRTVAFVRTGADGSSICTDRHRRDGHGGALSARRLGGARRRGRPTARGSRSPGEDGGIYIGDVDGSDPRQIVDRSSSPRHLTLVAGRHEDRVLRARRRDRDPSATTISGSPMSHGVTQVNITGTSDAQRALSGVVPGRREILFSRETLAGASLMTIAAGSGRLAGRIDRRRDLRPEPLVVARRLADRLRSDLGGQAPTSTRCDRTVRSSRSWRATRWTPPGSRCPRTIPSRHRRRRSPRPGRRHRLGLPRVQRAAGGRRCGRRARPRLRWGRPSVDTAYLATKMSDVGGCPQADRASNILGIDLTGDGRIDAEYGPISCELDCMPFIAIDLDDDGDDESLVQQLGGAILGLVPYASLGSDAGGGRRRHRPTDVVAPRRPRERPAGRRARDVLHRRR